MELQVETDREPLKEFYKKKYFNVENWSVEVKTILILSEDLVYIWELSNPELLHFLNRFLKY